MSGDKGDSITAQAAIEYEEFKQQMKDLLQVNKALLARLEVVESKVNQEAPSTTTSIKRKKKKSKNKTTKTKTEHHADSDGYASDTSNESNLSMITNDDDLEVIRSILKPNFVNQDQLTKEQLSQLTKIQERYRSQIPKLKYSKLEDGKENVVTHNYGIWLKQLLKYFTVLSPSLANTVKYYLSTIDVDEFIESGNLSAEVPELSDEEYPLITKLAAVNAITDSLSSDFKHLADDSMTDIFSTLTNISVICAPNSQEDRNVNIARFWTLKQEKGEELTQFSRRILEFSKKVNEQFLKPQISTEQVTAAFINGVNNGAESAAYKEAIRVLKFQRNTNRTLQSIVLWLHRQCDRSKIIGKPKDQSLVKDNETAASSSAVRTRGGKGGGRGKGGRGRGRGGKNRGGKNNQSNYNPADASGKINWKDTYYVAEDQDGEEVVTRAVPQSRVNKPCFTQILHGSCSNFDECPYNHEFNIVDLRKPNVAKDAANSIDVNEQTSDEATTSNANVEAKKGSESEDSAFEYAYELGFKSSAASVITSNTNNHKFTKNNLECLVWIAIIFISIYISSEFNLTTTSITDDIQVNIMCLFTHLFSMKYEIITFILSNLLSIYSTLHLKTFPKIFTAVQSLIGCEFLSLTKISALSAKFISSCPPLLMYVFLFSAVLLIDGRLLKRKEKLFSFGASIRNALYAIILDCGCTFTMSGDIGLFVKSSLVQIDQDVGLAESGFSSKATHKGKIIIDGKALDALYVPDFKQTMISMGQLERMGLHMVSSGSTRKFCTDKGDTFLSFYLAPNNLYPLLPTEQSVSSGKDTDRS